MATKRLAPPRDPIALAKLIGDITTGAVVGWEGLGGCGLTHCRSHPHILI